MSTGKYYYEGGTLFKYSKKNTTEFQSLYKVGKYFSLTLDSVSEPSQANIKVLAIRTHPG